MPRSCLCLNTVPFTYFKLSVHPITSDLNQVKNLESKIWRTHEYFILDSAFIDSRCLNSFRSSRSQLFFKIGTLKNFANFTGKQLCWSIFLIKLEGLRQTPTKGFYRTSPVNASVQCANIPGHRKNLIFSVYYQYVRRCFV